MHECKTDEDTCELLSRYGQTRHSDFVLNDSNDLAEELCFHCDINNIAGGISNDDCSHEQFVLTKDTANNIRVFRCIDDHGDDDSWKQRQAASFSLCSGSLLHSAETLDHVNPVIWKYRGLVVNDTQVLSQNWSDICVMYECEPGYRPNADKTDCELDTSAQNTCEAAPSYGVWDTDDSVCRCTKEHQQEKDAGRTCECESGYEYDTSLDKCVDPDSGQREACENSGGIWDGSTHTCTCDAGKGLSGPNGDGKCYCSNSGETYSATAGRCVPTEQAVCENSGGTWNGSDCECDSGKNVKKKVGSDPVVCECVDENYELSPDPRDGCKFTSDAIDRQRIYREMKKQCEDWGGTWAGDKLNEDTWICTCPSNPAGIVSTLDGKSCKCDDDNGYMQDSFVPPYTCKIRECDEVSASCNEARLNRQLVVFEDITIPSGRRICKCSCFETNKEYDYGTKTCIDRSAPCPVGAKRSSTDGKCYCTATRRQPVNGRCPSGTGGSGGQNGTPSDASDLTQNIAMAISGLQSISGSFGRSHWKNASGNFNTARLASDSIAGVVLGTVGGVVTSNVIKKNQVRGGFEDMKCVIGGQTVADWGDQFQVGIR